MGLLASSASALAPPTIHQIAQAPVLRPNGVAYDPWNDEVWVSSVGPPPRLYFFDENSFLLPKGFIDLPADADPGSMEIGPDGYLYVIDHGKDRIFKICPDCGGIIDVITDPAGVSFLTGYINGYLLGPTVLDFGNSFGPGSVWFGPNFGMQWVLPDTITPNGGDILPDVARASNGRVQDEILFADADHNTIIRLSDSLPPRLLGTIGGLPGNPGIQPPRDLDVNPLNLNPNVLGPAIHPIFIPFPDLGIYTSIGPNGPWTHIPATGIDRPTQIASDCTTVGATSFNANLLTVFRIDPPKGSHCEDFVELLLRPESGTPITLAGALKAYVDGSARLHASGGAPGEHGQAYEARKKGKKLKLTAGKLTRFKVNLPSSVQARLRTHHKVIVRVKIRVTNRLGQKATVTRRVRIRS